ncbi:MAG TPA: DUF3379 family protein [Gammaproteobacteria bacterium]
MSLTCLEFRQITGAVPDSRDAAVLAHRLECRACAEFARAQIALDRRLQDALRIPVPDDLKARVIWKQAGRDAYASWRWPAVAAGLILTFGLAFALLRFGADEPLAAAVIAHLEHEPELLGPAVQMAEPVRVSAVLDRGGVASPGQSLENVSHAGLCPFRGRLVPHLVMRVNGEPVSVLLLPDERIDAPQEIHENGYHGLLISRDGGSMAIVAPRPELVMPVRRQLEQVVRWKT